MERSCAICGKKVYNKRHYLCSEHYKMYGTRECKNGKSVIVYPDWLVALIQIERHNYDSWTDANEVSFSDLPNLDLE
jgi:hypothetical protein